MTDTDEIARLRALWCEEKSKSMTFYTLVERLRVENARLTAEVAALKAEVAQRTADLDRMTGQLNAALDARETTQRTLDGIDGVLSQRTAERDEARREVCELLARSMKGPMEIAADRGWDCFDEKEDEA
jgi:chromosome segregation ATPase